MVQQKPPGDRARRQRRLGRMGFLSIAAIFHVIYAMSIFDIYFVSPIVHGMTAHSVQGEFGWREAPANRLVLFVGDGLRADKAFQSHPDPSPPPGTPPDEAAQPRPLMPFLRQKVLKEGTFGVSHTRVPTESRPGHVALIAGLYEDVSAVTTGWKLNPVNFDSVFNRSRHTWCWGSPDILPMFKEGASDNVVEAFTYGAEEEDFTSVAFQLDLWVFDRVKQLFATAKTDPILDAQLRQDKVVFFLHLLGLDTTGHAYRPYSKEYLHNIKVVDEGVKEITNLIDEFYDDGKTAYVFTADHGMSDWGSHGDGHPDNTRTPLVAWGSGVAKPVLASKTGGADSAKGHEDGFSSDWGFNHVQRNDVAQADVAALMAYLAGLEFPVNSVGELPLAYLDASPKQKAEALLANALEVLEQYRVKEEQKKDKELRYVPYEKFGDPTHSSAHRVAAIRELIQRNKLDEAIKSTEDLIQDALGGMRYLQTYDWLLLRALVTTGYLGFIAFALTTLVDTHVLHGRTGPRRTTASNVFFTSVLAALFAVLFAQKSAWSYYCYAVFPVFFWESVWARRGALREGAAQLFGSHWSSGPSRVGLLTKSVAYVALLETLVRSYESRELYTYCYLLATVWPLLYGGEFIKKNLPLVGTWIAACGALSVFTMLPANKVEDLNLILLGGGLLFAVGLLYLLFEDVVVGAMKATNSSEFPISRTIFGAQTGLVLLAILVTRSSVVSLQAKLGLPLGTQIVGWLVMIIAVILPLAHSLQPNSHYLHRLAAIFLAFSPAFVILTISYEGLFYFAFCLLLLTWVRLEHAVYRYTTASPPAYASKRNENGSTFANGRANGAVHEPADLPTVNDSPTDPLKPASPVIPTHRAFTLADARVSLFSLYLLQSAFFSTGNIASVSSFSLDAVYRLIPVFDPFSQGALLIFKILIPFALLSAHLGILTRRLGVSDGALFMLLVAAGDYMTIRFFWAVRDEGSWLQIGSTISQFCIASALSVFVAGLEALSGVMVRGLRFDDEDGDEGDKRRQRIDGGKSASGSQGLNGSNDTASAKPAIGKPVQLTE